MKKNLLISHLDDSGDDRALGIVYPLVVTGLAQVLFPRQANGSLIQRRKIVGSRLIGQPFSARLIFISAVGRWTRQATILRRLPARISAPRTKLCSIVSTATWKRFTENPSAPIPVDLVTTSGSGLDPEFPPPPLNFRFLASPASAESTKANCAIDGRSAHRATPVRISRRTARECPGTESRSRCALSEKRRRKVNCCERAAVTAWNCCARSAGRRGFRSGIPPRGRCGCSAGGLDRARFSSAAG